MKTLAAIVLNWNGLSDTRALLGTLRNCATPEGWRVHVMVVDNGSGDGSATALAREFPEIEVLALPENRRFAGGNNAGLLHALGAGADAMMLLNNDTEADPQLFARLVLALEQEFDLQFEPEEMDQMHSISHIINVLENKLNHRSS